MVRSSGLEEALGHHEDQEAGYDATIEKRVLLGELCVEEESSKMPPNVTKFTRSVSVMVRPIVLEV